MRAPNRMAVSRAAAERAPTVHSFAPGRGYVRNAAPLIMGPCPQDRCDPSAVAADGSVHVLQPPAGAKPMEFRWVKSERAWARHGGKRMAFKAAYLSSHGWTYIGPA